MNTNKFALRGRTAPLALAMVGALAALASTAVRADSEVYPKVTDERLKNPDAQSWLSYRGNYQGWGFSPLKHIDAGNVGKLQTAWSFTTGMTEGHQAPPIVNGRYMFVTTPGSQIIALDATNGTELWRYKKQLPAELTQLHPTNRGVALYGDKLYFATLDCMLVALDAKTGKVLWQKPVGDWKAGYYMTLAPLVAKGKVMVGSSGGEFGVRGFVAAYDAESGNEAWRLNTVPGPGEPGHETWPAGDAYKTGGASIWITGSYDAETGLAFWGTGNPAPWTPETRKGDNLYTSAVIAIDVETGKLKGHHQYTWNDSWDWDEVSPPLLIDTEYKGKKVKAAVHAGRNGYLWVLERTADKINFVDAWPYVNNNVFKSIDPKTGRPEYDMARKPGMGGKVNYCPSLWGGKDWPPEAYNPQTGLFYIPANNNMCTELPAGEPLKYKPGELFIGFPLDGILTNVRLPKPEEKTIGELQAWDIKTGKQVWVHKFPTFLWTPLLTTGGNLVFAGGTNDRKFRAFDARDGKLLWETATPSGVTGVPSSYEVDGEQYVAVQSGWGVDAERLQGAMNAVLKTKTTVPQGGTVMVFKLPK